MAKSILGNDPFAPAAAKPDEKAAESRPAEKKRGKRKTKQKLQPGAAADAATDAVADAATEAPSEDEANELAAPADPPAATPTTEADHPPGVQAAEPAHTPHTATAAADHPREAQAAEPVDPRHAEARPATPPPPQAAAPSSAPDPAAAAPDDTAEYGPPIDDEAGLPGIGAMGSLPNQARYVAAHHHPAPHERRRVPFEALWRPYRALAMRDRSDSVDQFGHDPRVAARFDPLLDFFYRRYFRVDCQGLGHIPDEGRALLVANHSGGLPWDGAMIMHAVRAEHEAHRFVRPLVEDFVFHFPYLGTIMNRLGGVRACPENAERLLREDQVVAVFPEGIKGIGKLWGERYQLQRFGRGGFVKLALATDAPIVPVAVVGAEEIHPMLARVTWLAKSFGVPYLPITPTFPLLGPLGLVPLPSKWFIAFGEPLYFNAEYGAEAANDRILVGKLSEQVRQRVQEMVDTLRAQRRSVFRG